MYQKEVAGIVKFLDKNSSRYTQILEEASALEGNTDEPEYVKKCVEYFQRRFTEAGLTCELCPCATNAPALIGGRNLGQKPFALFTGHLDTVFAKGSFHPGEQTVQIRDGRIYGPGVADMKGGVVVALATIEALNSIGYQGPLKVFFCGDEETGHVGAEQESRQLFLEACTGAKYAFNLESTSLAGQIITGRKGALWITVKTYGKSAHAGKNFYDGANAIAEMAHKLLEIAQLTDASKSITCNLGVITGGTVPNAVADYCEAVVDFRLISNREKDRIFQTVQAICRKVNVPGTRAECSIVEPYTPCFERTESGVELQQQLEAISLKYNLQEFQSGEVQIGGASDAALVSDCGVPTICGCGIRGEYIHSQQEFAELSSLTERAKVLAAAVLEL